MSGAGEDTTTVGATVDATVFARSAAGAVFKTVRAVVGVGSGRSAGIVVATTWVDGGPGDDVATALGPTGRFAISNTSAIAAATIDTIHTGNR